MEMVCYLTTVEIISNRDGRGLSKVCTKDCCVHKAAVIMLYTTSSNTHRVVGSCCVSRSTCKYHYHCNYYKVNIHVCLQDTSIPFFIDTQVPKYKYI